MGRQAWVPIAGALCAATGSAQPVEPRLPDVLGRTVAYVERFHTQFASIIADEQYEQEVFRSRVAVPDTYGLRAPLRRRSLRSEFVLVFVPKARAWLGFRDVISVDGKPVRDRDERLARRVRR